MWFLVILSLFSFMKMIIENKNIILFLIGLIILIFPSCKKNSNDFIFTGKVYSPNENKYIPNVKICLQGQVFQNNTWNSNFSELGSTYTKSDGSYILQIEKKRTNGLQLVAYHNSYISVIKSLNYEDIPTGEEYPVDFNIYPRSYLQIIVKDNPPYNPNTEITVSLHLNTSDCNTCLQSKSIIYHSNDLPDTIFGMVYGHQSYEIEWTQNDNGNISHHTETPYCATLDTTTLNIAF